MLAMALFLAGCNATGRDISVAEFSSHMRVPFDKLEAKHKAAPAEVIIIGPAKEREREWVEEAVGKMNTVLPACAQLRMGAPRPALTLTGKVKANGRLDWYPTGERGKLFVEFVHDRHFYDQTMLSKRNRRAATAWARYIQVLRGANVYKNGGRLKMVKLLVHEMLHAVGLKGHVPHNVRSRLAGGGGWSYHDIVSESDRAVLAHLYPCTG